MLATSARPWKTAALKTRMAALTKNATFRASAESIRLYLHAWALLARSSPILRDWTSAECKYRLWGITVAPRMPIATSKEPGGKLGRNPFSRETASGRARRIWSRKQPPIVTTSAKIAASIFLIPNRWSQSSMKVSQAVTRHPHSNGRPNNSFRAITVPTTSARSQAAIATSARAQSTKLTGREYSDRQACARSCPVTTPNLAESVWSTTAIRLDIKRTQSKA